MDEMHKARDETKKDNKKLLILIAVLLVVAIVVGGVICFFLFNRGTDEEEDFYDPMAVSGILPSMSEDEIQNELDRIVEEGMININIASEISFADSSAEGVANIQNSEANHYVFKVRIDLDDTGETVYESGGIKPGQYIQYITLSEELEAGTYDATATFTAYTEEDLQIAGSVAVQLTLYILG